MRLYFEQGQVGGGVRANQFSEVTLVVVHDDFYVGRLGNNVMIGDHVAVVGDNNTRTRRACRSVEIKLQRIHAELTRAIGCSDMHNAGGHRLGGLQSAECLWNLTGWVRLVRRKERLLPVVDGSVRVNAVCEISQGEQ